MKQFTMNQSIIDPNRRPRLAADEAGCLYDTEVRGLMSQRLPPEALSAVEGLGALRYAAKMLHLAMERWAEGEGLSEGRLMILFRLRHSGDGLPLGELATLLDVSPRNVTGLVDHLER